MINQGMKKLACVLMIAVLGLSCHKQDSGQFELEYIMDFEIEAGLNPLLTHYYTFNVNTNWNEFLNAHQLNEDQISKVLIKGISISPIFSGPISYSFIESAKLFIYLPNQSSFKLPIGEVFTEPNEKSRDLQFLPGFPDVHTYLKELVFISELRLNYRGITSTNSNHRMTVTFDVYIK